MAFSPRKGNLGQLSLCHIQRKIGRGMCVQMACEAGGSLHGVLLECLFGACWLFSFDSDCGDFRSILSIIRQMCFLFAMYCNDSSWFVVIWVFNPLVISVRGAIIIDRVIVAWIICFVLFYSLFLFYLLLFCYWCCCLCLIMVIFFFFQ